MHVTMSPWLLATAAIAPLVFGLLAAWPFWVRRVTDNMGSIVGAAVILIATVGFVAREFGDVLEITRRCVEAEIPCRFRPQPFVRYAIYGGIGMIQTFAVFVIGLEVEEQVRRRGPS
jgi:hypothetical protein